MSAETLSGSCTSGSTCVVHRLGDHVPVRLDEGLMVEGRMAFVSKIVAYYVSRLKTQLISLVSFQSLC